MIQSAEVEGPIPSPQVTAVGGGRTQWYGLVAMWEREGERGGGPFGTATAVPRW